MGSRAVEGELESAFDGDSAQRAAGEQYALCEVDASVTEGGRAAEGLVSPGGKDRRSVARYLGPRQIIALLALAIAIIGAWYLQKQGVFDPALLQHFVRAHPVIAPLVATLIYALAVLTGLPTLPLNLAAGMFWGAIIGGLITTVATTLGGVAAFAAARFIFGRPLACRFDNKVVAQFQREFEQKGWSFLAFIRLNPIFPTGPLNYVLGLTAIDGFTYVWATFVFLLPPAIVVAFIGHSVGTFVVNGNLAHLITLVMVGSLGLTVLAGFAYTARFLYRRRDSE